MFLHLVVYTENDVLTLVEKFGVVVFVESRCKVTLKSNATTVVNP